IKTIARRGYRFIAPVAPADSTPAQPPRSSIGHVAPPSATDAIAVLDFTNVTGDADSNWLSAGIAETGSGHLRALGRCRVVDRRRVVEAARHSKGSFQQIAVDVNARLVVVGSFQRHGDRIRISARIVDVGNGEALADAKIDGPVADIFELQDQVAAQFSKELGMNTAVVNRRAGSSDTPSLDAYRAFTEGWLQLETLDIRQIPGALANFERAAEKD